MITLTPTTQVCKQYTTLYPGQDHLITLYVQFVNSFSNIVLSVNNTINWTNSSAKIFTINDDINLTNYKKISWVVNPPTANGVFNLIIGSNNVAGMNVQQNAQISYFNLSVQPIAGNLFLVLCIQIKR